MKPILLHGHTRPLTQIKYNREGDLLFTCARDKSPNVFFSHNGEHLGSYDGHNGAVYSIDTNYASDKLLTASADNSVKLWDVQFGKAIKTWEFQTAARSVGFAIGDREFMVLTDQRMGNPGLLNVYSVDGQAPIQSIVIPDARATVARWAALNKHVVLGHEDGTITVWQPKTGKKVKTVKAHEMAVTDIQMSADLTYFVSSSKDQTAKLIDAHTFEVIKTYKSDRPLNSVCTSPLKEHVVVGGGQEARDVTTTSATQGKFEVCFFHRVFGDDIGRVKGHFGPVNTLAFHPSGRSFSSGGEEGYVRIHHFDPDYFNFDDEMDI